MTRQVVHPTYCVEEKVWYTDDGVTAKSLASLQRKLPGVKIKDYHPNGFGLVVKNLERQLTLPWDEPNPKPRGVVTEGNPSKSDNWIRRHYVSPEEAGAIADDVIPAFLPPVAFTAKSPPRFDIAAQVKMLGADSLLPPEKPKRRRYSVPSVNLSSENLNWKVPARLEQLRHLLLVEKLPLSQIARRMGCSRNAVIGACHRHIRSGK
jgi:hypothetical protein